MVPSTQWARESGVRHWGRGRRGGLEGGKEPHAGSPRSGGVSMGFSLDDSLSWALSWTLRD